MAGTILMEFAKGSRAIASSSGGNLAYAMVTLTRRNTRRYGGFIVHLGIVLIFVGLTGAIFNREQKTGIHQGDRLQLGGFGLQVREKPQAAVGAAPRRHLLRGRGERRLHCHLARGLARWPRRLGAQQLCELPAAHHHPARSMSPRDCAIAIIASGYGVMSSETSRAGCAPSST